MPISFLDLRRQHQEIAPETDEALRRVMEVGVFVLGREVEAFEAEWADFCGARGAATVGNGTDALALALIASGAVRQGRGDEVITSALSAAYTALAIVNAGAVPVFCDIDPETYTLDPRAVERAITPRTRAVVPVHLYGRMADMRAICDAAARHHLTVIEDAAQAHGASLADGCRVGTFGRAAAFSFYPTKNLGAYGDGGAVVSNDDDLIGRVKILRQGGHLPALQGSVEGFNSRLDEIQAAWLRVKLRRLEEWTRRRRRLAEIYDGELRRSRLKIPAAVAGHVYHLYVAQHPRRDRLRARLAESGVETTIHYPYLLHQQPLFRQFGSPHLPVAERVAERIVSLPLYPQLSEDEVRAVANACLEEG